VPHGQSEARGPRRAPRQARAPSPECWSAPSGPAPARTTTPATAAQRAPGSLENSPGELLGFIRRYAAESGTPITTDGLNLGIDHFLDAIRADPLRVSLVGTEWRLPSLDGIRIVPVTPTPRFLWWVVHRTDARHPHVTRLLELIAELRHQEGWLDYDPDRDWLPDIDRGDLLA
jgi:hypothetical protein